MKGRKEREKEKRNSNLIMIAALSSCFFCLKQKVHLEVEKKCLSKGDDEASNKTEVLH